MRDTHPTQTTHQGVLPMAIPASQVSTLCQLGQALCQGGTGQAQTLQGLPGHHQHLPSMQVTHPVPVFLPSKGMSICTLSQADLGGGLGYVAVWS